MSGGGDGVTFSFESLFKDLSHQLEKGFDKQEKRSDALDAKLDRRIDELNRRLDVKADNTRVAALEAKHAEFEIKVEERLRPLEIAAATDEGVTTWKDKVGGAVTLFAASSVGAFLYYIVSLGHHT